jgi:hypothetical protein
MQIPDSVKLPESPMPLSHGYGCTCEEFRERHVCDHVVLAAAVRMVRRLIDIHGAPETQ